ncbi:MAG: hypothetical protein ACE5OZ_20875, partial [Candidatus Heimdallarchaeota archaeon]
ILYKCPSLAKIFITDNSPHVYYVALECFQPQGHMFRDYLHQLQTMENGRFQHLAEDLEDDVRILNRQLISINATPIITRFIWPRDPEIHMSRGESLMLQLQQIYRKSLIEYRNTLGTPSGSNLILMSNPLERNL